MINLFLQIIINLLNLVLFLAVLLLPGAFLALAVYSLYRARKKTKGVRTT